jgi:flagellar biosynthesis protein FlhF
LTIKKYEAATEEAAIQKMQEELGEDALILKIQEKKPIGLISKFLKKTSFEVTAALGEKDAKEESQANLFNAILEKQDAILKNDSAKATDLFPKNNTDSDAPSIETKALNRKIEELESKISDTEGLLSKVTERLTIANRQIQDKEHLQDNDVLRIFYKTLTAQGIDPQIAGELLIAAKGQAGDNEIDISLMVKLVYNAIVNTLKSAEDPFEKKTGNKNATVFAFIGPTGVGKTTTIAKLASVLILKRSLRLALITADTYRIAAVEQLRTYAEIIGIGIDAVYKPDDLPTAINKNKKINDIIFLDTAGRSHKNEENMKELAELLNKIQVSSRKFLVLSLATKSETLIEIIRKYSEFTDFDIIFTKADEADGLGAVFNACYLTGKKAIYISTGQNVPEDIELAKPEMIARSLLGLRGEII